MGYSTISRREFVIRAAALGGGLLVGFHLPYGSGLARAAESGPVEVNAWIVITPDSRVTIRVARSEMGQGIFTSLPMLVAEELECDWATVRAEYASAHEHLARNRVYVSMSTGGSRSVRESHEYLRRAGAVAREMLIAAAAESWGVPPRECRASDGTITHAGSGRSTNFGAVAAKAAQQFPPDFVHLKHPRDWKLIGRPVKRLDTADKVMGKPVFGTDASLPDMLHASIRGCPVFGGKVEHYDEKLIKDQPGVRGVVNLGDAVAVIADTWWQAEQALKVLSIDWSEGNGAHVSSASILAGLRAGLDVPQAPVGAQAGDADGALTSATRTLSAEYYAPYLAHATMEPMTCTARITPGLVEVWAPTQNAEATLLTAARAADADPGRVRVHNTMLGGGFGRRGAFQDFTEQAVRIAKAVGRPVKLLWSREEDTRHDFYRPVSLARFTAGLDAHGMPVAWKVRVAGHSILHSIRPGSVQGGLDPAALQGLDDIPYAIPNRRVEYAMRNFHVPVGFWRSVNHSQNAFFQECFLDELAHAAAQDPVALRRKLLAGRPKELAVLNAAAGKAGWGTPPAKGIHRGIALHSSFGTHVAQVAEISVGSDGTLRVHRVVCAIDSGHVVNPDTVAAQVESGIVYGLTAALYGEITIKDGRVEQGNFGDYPVLRMRDMPRVEVYPVPSGDFWGGIGEPPTPPIAPAVCNAIFAATGRRIRALPLSRQDLSA